MSKLKKFEHVGSGPGGGGDIYSIWNKKKNWFLQLILYSNSMQNPCTHTWLRVKGVGCSIPWRRRSVNRVTLLYYGQQKGQSWIERIELELELFFFTRIQTGTTRDDVLPGDPPPQTWTEWQTDTNENITFAQLRWRTVIKPRRFSQYWRRRAESFETYLLVCWRIKDSVNVFNVMRRNWMKFAPVRK